MKANVIRWCAAVLMLAALALFLSSPGLAAVEPQPLDLSFHGRPLDPKGWISKTEYQDESIHAWMETGIRKTRSSSANTTAHWVRVKIADPTQLRTALTMDSYENQSQARPEAVFKSLNAVVACNDDFAKYRYNLGYVVRQGVFYRDALEGSRDILIIDDQGDFSYVLNATSETMAAKKAELEADGRAMINTFSFGPVLVADGQVMPMDNVFKAVEAKLAAQRIAICQSDKLDYVIFEVDGGNGKGINLKELATYIAAEFPECKVAYNLDGGGSTNLWLKENRVHRTLNSRQIAGMIYFVSAVAGE